MWCSRTPPGSQTYQNAPQSGNMVVHSNYCNASSIRHSGIAPSGPHRTAPRMVEACTSHKKTHRQKLFYASPHMPEPACDHLPSFKGKPASRGRKKHVDTGPPYNFHLVSGAYVPAGHDVTVFVVVAILPSIKDGSQKKLTSDKKYFV